MSEIEKMYENAKVMIQDCLYSLYCVFDKSNKNIVNEKCKTRFCAYLDDNSFTAEKQLELIKWLAKTRPIHITFLIDKWVIEGMVRYGKRYDTFEDALSGYINNLWQDLTESEREQIRSILNG